MTLGSPRTLATDARVAHLDALTRGLRGLIQACLDGARLLATQAAEPALYTRRRDLALDLPLGVQPGGTGLAVQLERLDTDATVPAQDNARGAEA